MLLAGLSLSLLAAALAPSPRGGALAPPPPPVVPIYGGTVTAPGEWSAVVAVVRNDLVCSGTLISPRLVVTAAHCIDGLGANARVSVHIGSELVGSEEVRATRWAAHPDFCRDCSREIYDFAYVELERDVMLDEPFPAPLLQQDAWDAGMQHGGEVTLVGFGESDDSGVAQNGLGTKRKVTTSITKISAHGREFSAGGEGKDSCKGDSGGPAFVRVDDQWYLAGVLSRGTTPCGEGGVYGVPYVAACWLRDETGWDGLAGECSDCECLDIAPDKKGCHVGASHVDPVWLGFFMLLMPRRRRLVPSR